MLQLVQKKRRGWDSNPRSLKARPLFESGTMNHSDTSPFFIIPKLVTKQKPSFVNSPKAML